MVWGSYFFLGVAAGAVTMTADRACTVTFRLVKQTLTVLTVGSGSVTSAPAGINTGAGAGAAPFDWGTAVTLTATPNTGGQQGIPFTVRTRETSRILIRTFSPVGWIAAGLVVGSLPSLYPGWFGGLNNIESTAIPFQLSAGGSVLLGLYAFTLPHTPPKSQGRKVTVADVAGLKTLSLMKDRSFAVFVVCSLLLWFLL